MTGAVPDEAAQVEQICGALGLSADETQITALLRHLSLLRHWNSTYNLSAIRGPAEMLTQHLADCLAVVPALSRRGEAQRLLDVGSGGGLPGIVIAILLPHWQVTCVDAVAKKVAFLRQAAGALRLPNLQAEHARVEALQAAPFDLITARAFGSLADLVRLTARHLAPEGAWAAMKGRRPDDEIARLPPTVEVFHVEPLQVPGLSAQRCLVWMRPHGDSRAAN